jgi:exopolysaccharide biosynthesis polyprenyl glycosylphosphotransferase
MIVHRKIQQFFIACVDVFLLALALYLAMILWQGRGMSFSHYLTHLQAFIPLFTLWVISFYTTGLYSLNTPFTGYKAISTIFVIAVLCTLLGFVYFYFRTIPFLTPKTLLILHSAFVVALILAWRTFFNFIALRFIAEINVAFVNINNNVVELLRNMWKFSYTSYNARCILDPRYNDTECCGTVGSTTSRELCGVPVFKDIASFSAMLKQSDVKLIIFGKEGENKGGENIEFSQDVLFQSLRDRLPFVSLTEFYETYLRRIPISEITDVWFVRDINYKSISIYQLWKRIVDLVMSLLFLALTLPFWPLIILLVRLESPGPALFTQKRIGYLGKEFTMFKFRTMRITTEAQNPTVVNDPRVTRLGNFLRKTRVDEIPLIINVLRGEMSLIGPRPERPELVAELEKVIPYYRQRLLVKPGLSGWDQVSGEYHSPSVEDTYKKLQYDLYYIKNMSIFLDISIFFKTLVTVVTRSGV